MVIHVQIVETKVSSAMAEIAAILAESSTKGTKLLPSCRRILTDVPSYVEWLENERKILSLGVQEACRRLIEANLWPTESLPRVGRLLSIHDMLVALGLMQDLKDENYDDENSRRKKSKSPNVTAHASEERALDLNRHRTTSPSESSNHSRSHGEPPGPRLVHPVYPSFQTTATALASLLDDASLAKHNWPITAIRIPQIPRDSNLGQGGRFWSHTTDAYQQVSGPSNLGKRASSVMSGSDGVHRHENISRQNSGQTSRTSEAVRSEQDETTTDSDGDAGEYIKIPF